MGLQMDKEGYKRLQGFTGGNMGIRGVREGYRGLQGVTRG